MRRPPSIRVSPECVKPGEEYDGYEIINDEKNSWSMCCIIINENGQPLKWGKHPLEDEVTYFWRDMTYKERDEWYANEVNVNNSSHMRNLIGLHNDLYDVGDARHQMWNGWICSDWSEQLVSLEDEDFFIIGVAPAPYGCMAVRNPIAIVCEYIDNGDRFWCHSEIEWIDDMRADSKPILDKYLNNKKGNDNNV